MSKQFGAKCRALFTGFEKFLQTPHYTYI